MSGFLFPPVDVRNGIKMLLASIIFVQSIMICGEHFVSCILYFVVGCYILSYVLVWWNNVNMNV